MNIKREEIDKRLLVCDEFHTKPDSDTFIFEDFCQQTEIMAKEINYDDGVFGARIISISRDLGYGDYEGSIIRLEELSEDYKIEEVSLINQIKYYGAHVIYNANFDDKLELAVKNSKKVMELAEQVGDSQEVMRSKMNIGALSIELEYYETAIEFLSEATDYYESKNDYVLLCYCYYNIGEAYYFLNKFVESKKFLVKALDLSKQENEIRIRYSAIHRLGLIELKVKDYDKAIKRFKKAIRIITKSSLRDDFTINLDLVKVYILIEDYNLALDELKKIDEEVIASDRNEDIKRFYKYKARIYEEEGNIDEAYKLLKKFIYYCSNENNIKSHEEMNEFIQEEYTKTIDQLETIALIGRELTILEDIDEVLLSVRKELIKVLEVDVIGIGEVIGDELCFNHYLVGTEKVKAKNVPLNKKSSLATWCINNRKEVIINDLENEYIKYISSVNRIKGSHSKGSDVVQSLMYAPLIINEEVIGVFTMQSIKKNVYSSVEENIFKIIADYVSIAVKNVNQRLALEELSERDILTKMYNRRGFVDFFNQHSNDGVDKNASVGIIMLDLDYFKTINDKYGHLAGDEVLIIVARTLMDKECKDIRSGRLGGEEFGLIIHNKPLEEIVTIANSIRENIENIDIVLNSEKVTITTSVGVAFCEDINLTEYNQLYFEADHALYSAKANGRNNVAIYDNKD